MMEKKYLHRRIDNSMLKKYFAEADKSQRNHNEAINRESLSNKLQNKVLEVDECHPSHGKQLNRETTIIPERKVSFSNDVTDVHDDSRNTTNLDTGQVRVLNSYKADSGVSSVLKNMFCSGQKVELKGEKPDGKETELRYPSRRHQDNSQSVGLNKLYSSLKRLKSRHDSVLQEDIHTQCSNFPFNSSKTFTNKSLTNASSEEEIFILLGGKSKPVRFDVNPENINLIEGQFGMNLKVKSDASVFDREDLELLQKFREKYRCRRNHGTASPIVPWARHAVSRGKKSKDAHAQKEQSCGIPSATYQIEEEECGRKLSIHVYLPNVVPATGGEA